MKMHEYQIGQELAREFMAEDAGWARRWLSLKLRDGDPRSNVIETLLNDNNCDAAWGWRDTITAERPR